MPRKIKNYSPPYEEKIGCSFKLEAVQIGLRVGIPTMPLSARGIATPPWVENIRGKIQNVHNDPL